MKDAQKLLKLLTEAIKPCFGCHHNITLNGDNLVVTLMTEAGYQPFLLGVPDYASTVEELASDIIRQFEEINK